MRFPAGGNVWSIRLATLCTVPVLVGALAAAVTLSGTVARLDASVVGGAVAADAEPFTDWIRSVTALANTDVILIAAVLAIAVCASRRHWRGALTVALALAVSQMTVTVLKVTMERPRPEQTEALADPSGFSFPSGHAATAVAVYAVLALVAARGLTGVARLAVAGAGTLAVIAIGASRVYLGVHYPTDVVAGWLVGGAIALAAWWATEWIGERRRTRPA